MQAPAHIATLLSNVLVFDSRRRLDEAAAAEIFQIVSDTLGMRELCHVALAGGSTPRSAYAIVAKEWTSYPIEWERVHLYFSDERMVPPGDAESNYGMAAAELFEHIPIPVGNIHRMQGEVPAERAAALYTEEVSALFRGSGPTFDLTLLGLGEDGHTASLFPGTEAVQETQDPVVAVYVPHLGAWRTTLTLPIINRSREIRFLVSGAGKAAIIRRLMTTGEPTADLPASLVHTEDGTLRWMLDKDAAEFIIIQK